MIDRNPYARPEANESPCLEHVLYFVWEREAIRIAKENQYEGELTEDPILKQYRFCNVRRKDDRVSKWILENMLTQKEDVWFVAAVARFINWPPTLRKLIEEGAVPVAAEDFDRELFCKVLDDLTDAGEKVWTGAYMVRAVEKDSNKKSFAVAKYLQSAIEHQDIIREAIYVDNRVENLVGVLSNCYGFGTFMAGQVAADVSYVHKFDDVGVWAPMGPGSQRGLNRLYTRGLRDSWNQDEFDKSLLFIWREIWEQLDIEIESLHCVQNVMCEMDKYWRVLYGEGRPRATYKPETAF